MLYQAWFATLLQITRIYYQSEFNPINDVSKLELPNQVVHFMGKQKALRFHTQAAACHNTVV